MEYKFSIITPAHKKTPYLKELYDSIVAQTYENWEWVLWLNNTLHEEDLEEEIRNDDRVVIYRTEDPSTSVGYHKHHAFHKGEGDVLVEVDSDDILMPECLEELNKAYQDETIGFVYTDVIPYHMIDEFVPYSSDHGWTYHTMKWRGKDRHIMHSWQPTSHALSYIWYAPDHVRSWRTNIYRDIGGHNVDLDICDDHELMIRTYLVTEMFLIDKPLYVYRITGDNTWLERNQSIQKETKRLGHLWAQNLAERDADKKGLLKVDLGGGLYPRAGYMTIDQEGADINCDLNDGIPLEDNSVGVINASHVIEHLRDPIKTMREIHRVLVHGGWAFIEVPSTDGRGAWQDPTHVSFWNEHSFWYYTDWTKAQYIRNKDIRFQTYRLDTWDMAPQIPVVTAWLVAIKDEQRFPGELKI
jgi:glycosyltransferase involved in cell wall biosynthesis